MKKFQSVPVILLALGILAGCTSMDQNQSLTQAHNSYNEARLNPNVANLAAAELKDASDSLSKADAALSKGESADTVNHLAYLANQRVAIAQETAKQKTAELAVSNAAAHRTEIRLDARTAEANAAKKQAAAAQALADRQAEELAAANANAASDQALIAQQERELKDLNAKKTERGLVITLGDVLFSSGKAQLKNEGIRNVQKLADFLDEYPKYKVLIEGYTDSTGSDSFNQKLSERRANNVRTTLVDVMGINSDRIHIRGYGKEFPVATNNTATGRQLNRRVEIIISDENGNISSR